MRRVLGLVALAAVVVAGCAQSEEGLDDTLPTIAPVSTTAPTTTSTTAPLIPITAAASALATTTIAPTPAPTPQPQPTPQPPAPPPATTVAPAPTPTPTTAGPTTTAAPTTTSSLPGPTLTPLACTAEALNAADGKVHETPNCLAGWAVELAPCTGDECGEAARLFFTGPGGWVPVATVSLSCVGSLTVHGVPDTVAAQFAQPCGEAATTPRVIRRGDDGPFVLGVQTALVARGYDIDTDGTFGPGTEAAVRHFQAASGLEADGLVGPNTQDVLFAAST